MLNRSSSVPLYLQLEDILRSYIQNGDWKPSQMIPSENELSKIYGLSRMTVRSVITTLCGEGLLYRVQGKGTFVSPLKISAYSPAYVGIREQLEKQGYTTSTEIKEFSFIQPGSRIVEKLSITPADRVCHILRVRSADGEPVSIHESFIPEKLCVGLDHKDIEQEQLCHVLEKKFDLIPSHVDESLESVLASVHEANLLDISRGHPLLLMEELSRNRSGVLFEYTRIVFRGDKIRITFEYNL